ncbi:PREDICTED: uncharacterized protein LOC107088901 [Cyprinodon variegatus]|uniref:uncharacterized protein LOC107088901 n=1 Tax=Cyprinodon variegatus TaxID=28743 RepID=UPI00074260E3|nr:PREDICTED: uncharacterized protein LOC107088901 [Cyprinodon variegatus]
MKRNLQDIPGAVAKAKTDAHEILVSGRVFTFDQIKNIMRTARPLHNMIEELQTRHFVVRGIPSDFYHSAAGQQPGGHLAQKLSGWAAAEQSDESEGGGSSSSDETFQDEPNAGWQTDKRQQMLDRGLYDKHSRDHKLLRDYARYLHKKRQIENYRQDVANVARYLYYMDPKEPSLQFVLNKEKTQQYLRDLTQAGLMKQTQINYLKNLKRFLKFHTYHTDLKKRDPKLHGHCVDFIEFLGLQQGTLSKQVSKGAGKKEA